MKYAQPTTANISDQEKTFRTSISNDPALLYFLETGAMGNNERFVKQEIYKDPAFVAFISPYFQDAYVKAVFTALDQKDAVLMSDVAANPILLDYEHRQQAAFDQILVFLEEKKAQLASLHHKLMMDEPMDFVVLPDYTNIMTISNLNYLPGEFLEFRSAYAGVVMKVINSLCNRDLKMSINMISNLRQLTVNMQTSHDVDALYKILNNAKVQTSPFQSVSVGSGSSGYTGASTDVIDSSDSSDSRSSNRSIRNILLGIVFIIIIVIELAQLFSGNRGYRSHRYYPRYRHYRH